MKWTALKTGRARSSAPHVTPVVFQLSNTKIIWYENTRGGLGNKTSLTPPFYLIKVPVSSQESEWLCIWLLGVSILPFSTILIFEFGIVPTVWYFFIFHLIARQGKSLPTTYATHNTSSSRCDQPTTQTPHNTIGTPHKRKSPQEIVTTTPTRMKRSVVTCPIILHIVFLKDIDHMCMSNNLHSRCSNMQINISIIEPIYGEVTR
jgi:hypothetical protein